MSDGTFDVDLFWSYRSPFCYFTLDRVLQMQDQFGVKFHLRPLYPMAVRDPHFFRSVNPKYRKYHTADCLRVSAYLNMPFRRPIPDPIVQNLETSEISAEQPYIRRVTRAGAAAQLQGKALELTDKVMRMIWDGSTDNWHEGSHLQDAIDAADLDGAAILAEVEVDPDKFDAVIAENQAAHDASDHWGVPVMTFRGQTFYGQDRLELLLWCMQQDGLKPRI